MVCAASHVRTRLANLCYGQTVFNESMYHPAFVAFLVAAALALVGIAGWGEYWYTWIFFEVFFFALWVAILVVLCRNRKIRSTFAEGHVTTDRPEGQMVQHPVTVTHKQLDVVCGMLTQMIVVLVVIVSLMVVKCAFLIAIGATWQAGAVVSYNIVFYQVFCIVPDLAMTILLTTCGTMDLFALRQYDAVARDDEVGDDARKAPDPRDVRDGGEAVPTDAA